MGRSIDAKIVASLQFQYIRNKRLFRNKYIGAKAFTFNNCRLPISKNAAWRYMKKVDSWSEEEIKLFMLLYIPS